MSDSLNAMQSMLRAGDAGRVAADLEASLAFAPTVVTVPRPIVVYRSKKDIGKSERRIADKANDMILEVVNNVDDYKDPKDLARDLIYNDKDAAQICGRNASPDTVIVNKKIASPVRELLVGPKRDTPYIDTDPEILITDFKALAVIGTSGELPEMLLAQMNSAAADNDFWEEMKKWKTVIDNSSSPGEAWFKFNIPEGQAKMIKCYFDMCNRFISGTGETMDHREGPLYDAVVEHRTTKDFINQSINILVKKLFSSKTDGNLEALEFKPEMRGEYESNKDLRKYNVFDNKTAYDIPYDAINDFPLYDIFQKTVNQPKFDDFSDRFFGLGITIHDIWALKIQIENYQVTMSGAGLVMAFRGTYTLMIYDNFGLDDADIASDKFPGGYLYHFWAWYMLQHYTKFNGKYKPFVNQIIISFDLGSYIADNPINGYTVDKGLIMFK